MSNNLLKSLFILLAFSSLCSATTQICDRLIYDSNEYSGNYEEFPLEEYWSDEHPKPEWLSMAGTACYRGYIATWEVRNESLLLTSLSRPKLPYDETPIPLQKIFPDFNGPVLAEWFSGVLHCNRGKDYNKRLFVSFHKGKFLGIIKTTKEQLKNPTDKDLSWSSLLPANEKARAIRTWKWRLQSTRWIDGTDMFSWDGPLRSGKSFRLRGIYFPGGKLWASNSANFLLEIPDSAKLPTIVTPVEVTAKSTGKYTHTWYHLAVSHIKVLPVGSAIQHSPDNINRLIEYVIIIALVLVMLAISILGIKKRWSKSHSTVEN